MVGRRFLARGALVVSAFGFLACEGSTASSAAAASHTSLEGVVARVGRGEGALPISGALVAAVAAAARVPASEALRRLVDDALGARGALAGGLASRPDVAFRVVAAGGRAAVVHLRDAAVAAGPPSDLEVEALTRRHWKEVALPPQARVIHAVVLAHHDAGDAGHAQLARLLASRERDASSADDFEARAHAFAAEHQGLEVKVERLPPFSEDGRDTAPGDDGALDPTFAKAAFALGEAPSTSSPVETPFGWHVIRLLERLPAKEVPLGSRREVFREEVTNERLRRAIDALGEGVTVEVASDVDALLRPLSFAGDPAGR